MNKFSSGFTTIELIVVIFILSVIAAMSLSVFTRTHTAGVLDSEADKAVSLMREARSLTLASYNDSVYGFYATSTEISLFAGASYSSTSPIVRSVVFDELVEFSTVALDANNAVVFNRLSGTVATSGTLVLTLKSTTSKQRIFTIESTGIISIDKND